MTRVTRQRMLRFLTLLVCRVGQNHIHTMCIRYFWQRITKYTVLNGVYVRFWPTLLVCHPCGLVFAAA
jgi:hypothetical protein